MDTANRPHDAATLLRNGASTVDGVAACVVGTWQRIDRDLAPVVGPAGVAALYRRSLHVCARRHVALDPALGPATRTLDLEPLRAALLGQDAAQAAAIGADLLQTFHEILSRMVGPSLTERLTRSVWTDTAGDEPAEDQPA